MIYKLILIAQFLGIGFQVGAKLLEIDKKCEDDTFWQVCVEFWKHDKITMIISVLIIGLAEFFYFLLKYFPNPIIKWDYFDFLYVVLCLLIGFWGQKKIYQLFGKAEGLFDRKYLNKLDQ